MGTPQASAHPPITDFCSGWTLSGDATCPDGVQLQAGQLANGCSGTEGTGIVGAATSTATYTLVSGATVISYEYLSVLSSDSVSFDGVIVQAIFNGQTYTVDKFNPGGSCTPQMGVHQFTFSIPGVTGVVSDVRLKIGVYEDGFGDLTWADVTNLQATP